MAEKSEHHEESLLERIADKFHGEGSSSDSDNEKEKEKEKSFESPSSSESLKSKVFGSEKPVHEVFGGGKHLAGDAKTLVEILEDRNEIDIAKYITFVSAPEAGAIATFSGTTRDTFEGKEVIELQYESYVPMALKCLRSICSSARSTWSIRHVAVGHRLGNVPVGQSSVVVAVSAVHRGDAMEACRFVIDELKASVPIWKKEVYSNGEVWKENSEFFERKNCCGSKIRVQDENGEVE